jgi:sugar lactone lactonase YvrE
VLNYPTDVAVDGAGNVYIADSDNNAVKQYDPATGQLSTLISSGLTYPAGVAVDAAGHVYVAEPERNTVKEYNPATGQLSTLVSSGLSGPAGVALDAAGNVYIADADDNAIKEYDPATGQLITLVSSGLDDPEGVAVDSAGNVYIADAFDSAIKEYHAATGQLSTLVSSGLAYPDGVAVDGSGNVYVADSSHNAVKEYSAATGQLSTLVSSGLNFPLGVAVDASGNVYVADTSDGAVKEYNAATGQLSTLVSSSLSFPDGVAVGGAGNVYVADTYHGAIKEYNVTTAQLSTLVSSGLNGPHGLAVDASGNVYTADTSDSAVKEYDPATGQLSTLVSSGLEGPQGVAVDAAGDVYIADSGDGAVKEYNPATGQLITLVSGLNYPDAVAVDATGNVYIADTNDNAVKEYNAATGQLSTLASGLDQPGGVAVDGAGNVYVTDTNYSAVREYNAATGQLSTLASGLDQPGGLAVDGAGNVYYSQPSNNAFGVLPLAFVPGAAVSEPAAAGSDAAAGSLTAGQPLAVPLAPQSDAPWLTVGSVAGGVVDFSFTANTAGVPRTAQLTVLGQPVTVIQAQAPTLGDSSVVEGPSAGVGSVVLSDAGAWAATSDAPWLHVSAGSGGGTGNALVQFSFDANAGATRSGTLSVAGLTFTLTQAGSGYVEAQPPTTLVPDVLDDPTGVAVDGAGNVYIANSGNNAVKEYNAATGQLSTLVSSGLDGPQGVAVDAAGNVYIADTDDNAVKEYNAATGQLSTLVSSGLNQPEGVAVDSAGNVYVADTDDNAVKEYDTATGQLSTLVSSGLNFPGGVAVDSAGNVYIADTDDNAVQEYNAATGQLSTLASGLDQPGGVAVDGAGNVYVTDTNYSAVREYNAATGQLSTLASGLDQPGGLAVDGAGNVYYSQPSNNAFGVLPLAFVPGAAVSEPAAAGSDAAAGSLTAGQPLAVPLAPQSDAPWLTVGSVAGGVVDFSFTANTAGVPRTAQLTVLGQPVTVTQAGIGSVSFTTTPQILVAGGKSATTSIRAENGEGNALGNVQIDLSSSSATGLFYASATSTTPITSVTTDSNCTASFVYSDTTAGSPTLTAAQDGAPSVNATQTEAVASAAIVVDLPGQGLETYSPGSGFVPFEPPGVSAADVTVLATDAAGDVAAMFPGVGVERYQAGAWALLTQSNATLLALDAAGDVFGEFASGVYRYTNSTGWQQLTATNSSQLAVDPSGDVVGLFPQGVYRYSAATQAWAGLGAAGTPLANLTATLVAIDQAGDVTAEFPGAGVWQYTTGWAQLGTLPQGVGDASVLASDPAGDVAAGFPGQGVWYYTASAGSWAQLTTTDASRLSMDASGNVLLASPSGGTAYLAPGGTTPQTLSATTATLLAGSSGSNDDAGYELLAETPGSGVSRDEPATGAFTPLGSSDAALLASNSNGDAVALVGTAVMRYRDSTGAWATLPQSGVLAGKTAALLSIDGAGDVVADFPGEGLWRYSDSTGGWAPLSVLTALAGKKASVLAANPVGDLAADFPGQGVWRYVNGGGWQQLTSSEATQLGIDLNDDVAGEFLGSGVCLNTPGGGWTQLTGANASQLVIDPNGNVAAEFPGLGLFRHSAAGWQQLSGSDADLLAVNLADQVIAGFNAGGLTQYPLTSTAGTLFAQSDAALIASGGESHLGDYLAESRGDASVWRYEGPTGWEQLTLPAALSGSTVGPVAVNANGAVAAAFAGQGVWRYEDGPGWDQLTPPPALAGVDATQLGMDAAGDVFAEFPGHGVWVYTASGSLWAPLYGADASQLAVNFAGQAAIDVPGQGVLRYTPGSGFQLLTQSQATLLSVGGAGDVAGSFGPLGVYRYSDATGWQGWRCRRPWRGRPSTCWRSTPPARSPGCSPARASTCPAAAPAGRRCRCPGRRRGPTRRCSPSTAWETWWPRSPATAFTATATARGPSWAAPAPTPRRWGRERTAPGGRLGGRGRPQEEAPPQPSFRRNVMPLPPAVRRALALTGAGCLLAAALAPALLDRRAPALPVPSRPRSRPTAHWGGSRQRNMVNPAERGIADDWDTRPGKEKNVRWSVPLGSKALGGPVVFGGRIIVGTNNDRPGDPQASGDKGILLCLRESDGAFLWQLVHDKLRAGRGRVSDRPEESIASTPVVEGNRLWYVSNRCEVVCATTEGLAAGNVGPFREEKHTGRRFGDIVWKLDMIKELGVRPHNPAVCSPLLVGDTLFVVTGNGVGAAHLNIPAPDAPSFFALDKKTGKVLWSSKLPGRKILHGQWSNPVYATAGGKPQVIFPGGDGWLYPFTTQGGLLWKFDCNPKGSVYRLGHNGSRNHFVATPAVWEDRLYVGVGDDPEHLKGVGHLWCIDITKTPKNKEKDLSPHSDPRDETPHTFDPKDVRNKDSALVWHYGGKNPGEEGREYLFCRTLSTCAVHGGLCFAADLDGHVYCFDARTGKKHWEYETGADAWSSPYLVDGKVYLGNDNGVLHVFEAKKELKIVRKVRMRGLLRTPAVAHGGVLYVVSENPSRLWAIKT